VTAPHGIELNQDGLLLVEDKRVKVLSSEILKRRKKPWYLDRLPVLIPGSLVREINYN
jgi:hypothetical protein